jgi:hypothetical protein
LTSLAGAVGLAAADRTGAAETRPDGGSIRRIELLDNTGFEQGTEKQGGISVDVPKCWFRDWSGKGTVDLVRDQGKARSGVSCVRVEDTTIYQSGKVDCGCDYQGEVWIRGRGTVKFTFAQYATAGGQTGEFEIGQRQSARGKAR